MFTFGLHFCKTKFIIDGFHCHGMCQAQNCCRGKSFVFVADSSDRKVCNAYLMNTVDWCSVESSGNTRPSSLVTRSPTCFSLKITNLSFDVRHPVSGINFLLHFVSLSQFHLFSRMPVHHPYHHSHLPSLLHGVFLAKNLRVPQILINLSRPPPTKLFSWTLWLLFFVRIQLIRFYFVFSF